MDSFLPDPRERHEERRENDGLEQRDGYHGLNTEKLGAKDLFTKGKRARRKSRTYPTIHLPGHFSLAISLFLYFSQVMLFWIRMDKNHVLEHGFRYEC